MVIVGFILVVAGWVCSAEWSLSWANITVLISYHLVSSVLDSVYKHIRFFLQCFWCIISIYLCVLLSCITCNIVRCHTCVKIITKVFSIVNTLKGVWWLDLIVHLLFVLYVWGRNILLVRFILRKEGIFWTS